MNFTRYMASLEAGAEEACLQHLINNDALPFDASCADAENWLEENVDEEGCEHCPHKTTCPLALPAVKKPTILELIQALAHARHKEAGHKQEAKRLQMRFMATADGHRLAEIRTKLLGIQDGVRHAVKAVQEAALAQYADDGKKRPHQAVTVKVYKFLEYDSAAALDYSREHLPSALKLDAHKFEKAAKAIDLDFVETSTELRVAIARDLSEFLTEDSDG